jgi:hypothetical protein
MQKRDLGEGIELAIEPPIANGEGVFTVIAPARSYIIFVCSERYLDMVLPYSNNTASRWHLERCMVEWEVLRARGSRTERQDGWKMD